MFSVKHTKNLDIEAVIKKGKEDIDLMIATAEKAKQEIEAMAKTKVSQLDMQILTAKLTNNKELLELIAENRKEQNASLLDQIVSKSNRSSLSISAIESEQSRVGKAILDDIMNSPGADMESAKNTVWGWLNGVTYYTDNQSGSDDNRMKSAWFGPNADLKDKAYELALEYVKASAA